MSVDSVNPAYTHYKDRWQRCRDCFEGQDAIQAQGELYLPRLAEQNDDQYDAYKLRAGFFNAFLKAIFLWFISDRKFGLLQLAFLVLPILIPKLPF